MSWELFYTRESKKDAQKIKFFGLKNKVEKLIEILRKNPLQTPPPYEKLIGDLKGAYSRRINIQHRLVYQILVKEHAVKIIKMWTHYES